MGMKTRKVDPVVAEMQRCSELLEEFGLQLYGYDPGVTAFLWRWLKPLLEELRDRRRTDHGNEE